MSLATRLAAFWIGHNQLVCKDPRKEGNVQFGCLILAQERPSLYLELAALNAADLCAVLRDVAARRESFMALLGQLNSGRGIRT